MKSISFQALIGSRFVHIEENAWVGDLQKFGLCQIFADYGVGRLRRQKRQQLRKQRPADDDRMAMLAFVGRDDDRSAGGLEMLEQFPDDLRRNRGMIDEAEDDGFGRVRCGRSEPQLQGRRLPLLVMIGISPPPGRG